jgi:hypothetical protein
MKQRAGHLELIQPGRGIFLTAVSQVNPKVLQDLKRTLLPLAKARKEFEVELQAWGERWSLTDGWILDAARNQVRLWVRSGVVPAAGDRPLWHYPSGPSPHVFTRRERAFMFKDFGWPIERAWGRDLFIENTTSRFAAQLAEYCDRIERLADERGVKPHPVKRRRKGSPFKHYEWLARVHLGLATPAELATEAGVKLRAVQVALKETAAEIDLSPPVLPARRRPTPQRKYRRGPRN